MFDTYRVQTFGFLVAAFALSLMYEIYRDTLMAGVTQFDSAAQLPPSLAFYAVAFAVSALVLLDRTWTWWTVLAFLVLSFAAAIFFYLPLVLPLRMQGPIDAAESVVYLALLGAATSHCVNRLRGVRLEP